jgi:NADPH oxidase
MELRIVKPSFKYVAGQWLFINVPEVSKFQWHPVRIHSAIDVQRDGTNQSV